jgi:AraC-like DNA-binding protein
MPRRHATLDAFISSYAFKVENHIGAHDHKGFELLYLTEGFNRIVIDGKAYRAAAGDLVIFHPGVVHEEFVQPGPYRIVCLRFPKGRIAEDVRFPGRQDIEPVIHLPWHERFYSLFEQLVIENRGMDTWSPMLAGTYLAQFVILLWRALSHHDDTRPDAAETVNTMRISHVLDFIHSEVNPDIALKDLAAKAFMSPSRFSHVFKDVTGVPPKRYVIEARIAEARDRLTHTDDPVVEIARSVGYDNPQYFSRLFKKACGCTPLQYRRRARRRPSAAARRESRPPG